MLPFLSRLSSTLLLPCCRFRPLLVLTLPPFVSVNSTPLLFLSHTLYDILQYAPSYLFCWATLPLSRCLVSFSSWCHRSYFVSSLRPFYSECFCFSARLFTSSAAWTLDPPDTACWHLCSQLGLLCVTGLGRIVSLTSREVLINMRSLFLFLMLFQAISNCYLLTCLLNTSFVVTHAICSPVIHPQTQLKFFICNIS